MTVRVLVVPYDSGRCRERMGRGPDHLLERAIRPLLARLGHGLETEEIALDDPHPAEIRAAFRLCGSVSARVRAALDDHCFPLVLSGNCNIAVGAMSGCGVARTRLVWFDAHGEATTPDTTTSGFLDGMGISILTGACWQTIARSVPGFAPLPGDRIDLIGARDLEPAEVELLDRAGVRRLTDAADLAIDGPAYVHFDLDALDPADAVANQWAPPGGLTVDSVAAAARRLAANLLGAGIASYDPDADRDGRAAQAAARILEALFSGLPGRD